MGALSDSIPDFTPSQLAQRIAAAEVAVIAAEESTDIAAVQTAADLAAGAAAAAQTAADAAGVAAAAAEESGDIAALADRVTALEEFHADSFAEDIPKTSRTSTSYAEKLTLPFVAVAGDYDIDWYCETKSETDKDALCFVRVELDDAGIFLGRSNITADSENLIGWDDFSGFARRTLTPGNHRVDLDFRSTKTGESVAVREARLRVVKRG